MTRSRDIADQQENLGGPVPPVTAGKNAVINGGFDIWQRGTSFTNPTNGTFVADRYSMYIDGSGATRTISQQSFTPGSQPSGFYGQYFFRYAQTVAGTGASVNNGLLSRIEDVNTLQNQTVTLSFWMKADASRSVTWTTYQEFGSGGSGAVSVNSYAFTATTSWQRFTQTFTMPSLTGKTIGTGSSLTFIIGFPLNAVGTYDFTGVQLESGSAATPYSRQNSTIQGELAACQRYYQRYTNDSAFDDLGYNGRATNSTTIYAVRTPYVPFRTVPSAVDFANVTWITQWGAGTTGITNVALSSYCSADSPLLVFTTTGVSSGSNYIILSGNVGSGSAYIGLSAEL